MKIITIHYTPLIILLLLGVSIGFGLWFSHSLVGVVNYHEKQVTYESIGHCREQGDCDVLHHVEIRECTWNLIEWKQECYSHFNYWLLGLILSSFFSTLWFGFLFWWANREKKWLEVKWVE